ncbi:MAG: hypothetical protein K8R58_12725 [Bacteroidales bacterium]|nr:hypothetical protein [Bacteroidales bacterium]
MKTNNFYFLIFIFIITHISLLGQSIPNEFIDGVSASSIKHSANNDVKIINENNTIEITGRKASFIKFSITKKIKFKVLTLAGVERFSKFTLPETFDPTYISHFPKDRNYTNVYTYLECNYFKGTITTKNGERKDAEIKQTIDHVKMVMVENNIYGNFEKYIYQIENLNIGDEVIVEYNYDIKYFDNFAKLSSFRIYFNNDIFKENYQLTITHNSELNINIDFKNNATPDSIIDMDNKKVYYWNKSNLYGCINEEGCRPYLSMPHLIFSIKPYELLYTLPYSFEEKYIPFYSLFSYQREKNHLGIARSIFQGVNTKQFIQIEKFVKTETQDITNDSLGYFKLMKINNTIVDEFKFENDINYFKRIDTRDPRIGDYVSKKTVRDISRYDLYVALILKLDLNYFTAYLCDNRTGEISNEYFAPMYDSDYLFAVLLKNNSIQYLYPKKSRFGYYLNEIPFYFENAKARLVHLNDYLNYKNPIDENLRQIILPYRTENTRRNNIMVKINLDTLSAIFNARINLSGQYSTLTRGLYQYNHKDETINKLYNKKIWELNDQVQVISQETKVNSKEFPFPTVVNTQYQFNNLLETNNDTISLNLKNWFNHIIYNDFDTTYRQLDFYPDFCGIDSYVYYIQFDKNIKLISSFDSTKINNEFGELIISVEQIKPNALKITSYFVITNNKVTVDKIRTVKEIYDKIQEMNNHYLIFKLE